MKCKKLTVFNEVKKFGQKKVALRRFDTCYLSSGKSLSAFMFYKLILQHCSESSNNNCQNNRDHQKHPSWNHHDDFLICCWSI